jgi:hypothetical protein
MASHAPADAPGELGAKEGGKIDNADQTTNTLEAELERCRKVFSHFDKMGNGVIRWAELHAVMMDLGVELSSNTEPGSGIQKTNSMSLTDQLLQEADSAGDGVISFEGEHIHAPMFILTKKAEPSCGHRVCAALQKTGKIT